jgi:hypothetical protein
MSNSLIPVGPSRQDVSEMERLRQIMNGGSVPAVQEPLQAHYAGGHQGTRLNESRAAPPPPMNFGGGPSRADVDAMKNLLTKINELSGEDEAPARPAPKILAESGTPWMNNAPVNGAVQVIAMLNESNGKENTTYSVVDATRQDIVGNLKLKEAALAIAKLINSGQSPTGSKVNEVLGFAEDYDRNRSAMAQNRDRYTQAKNVGEAAAAKVFKERFETAKANALAAQDDITALLSAIR